MLSHELPPLLIHKVSTIAQDPGSEALEEEERVGVGALRGIQDGGEEAGRDDVGNATDLAEH